MAGRVRAFDWAATPLGPIETWPASLRHIVDFVLASPELASVAVGPQRILIYNDVAATHYGANHPRALGRPLAETFDEFPKVAGFYDRAFAGESVHVPAQPLDPSGEHRDDVYEAFLTPIRDDAGMVVAVHMSGIARGGQARAEAAQRESEARYRSIFESMDDGFYLAEAIFDADGKCVDLVYHDENAAAIRMTGQSFKGKRLSELGGYEPYWYEIFGNTAKTGTPHDAELFAAPDRIWYSFHTFKPPSAGANELVVVFSDVTVQHELAESEALRRVALSGGRMGSWRWDRAADRIRGDAQFMALWGLPPSDEELPLASFAARMTPAGAAEMAEIVAKAVAAGEEFSGPLEIVAGPTAGHWVQWQGRAADDDPAVLYGVTYDITEQRTAEAALCASEEKYRTLFETMGQGYAELEMIRSPDGRATDIRYLELNPQYERLTGIPVAEARGRTVFEMIPDFDGWWIEEYDRIVRSGQPGRIENEVTTFGRWYEASVYPRGGERFDVLFEDITVRKKAEISLRESEERQAFLLKLSDAVRPLADPADIQGETTRLLRERLGAGWCYYVDWDLDKKVGLVLRDSADEGLPSLTGAHDVSDAPEFLELLADGAVRTVSDYASYEQLPAHIRQKFAALGFRSMMMAPLVKDGRLIATLIVGDTKIRDWSTSEASLLREVAERTWAAVERARAEGALRDSEARLTAELAGTKILQRLATRLIPEQSPEVLHDEIMDAALELVQADAVSIQLLDEDRQQLRRLATKNLHHKSTEYWTWVDASHASTCGKAFATNSRTIMEDVEAFPELAGTGDLEAFRHSGTRAVQSTPLVTRAGKPIGMISTHWRTPRKLSEEDFGLFDILARQVADLLDRSRTETVLREEQDRQAFLLELSDAIRAQPDTASIGWTAMRMVHDKLGVDRAYICHLSRTGEWARIEYEVRNPGLASCEGHYDLPTFPDSRRKLETGPLVYPDVPNQPDISDLDKQSIAAMGMQAFMAAVLREGPRDYIWTISIGMSQPRQWTDGELLLLQEAAERVWSAIQRKAAEAALRESEERQAFLLKLSDALRPLGDVEAIQAEAMRLLGEQLGVNRAQYYIADETGEYLSSTGGWTDGVPAAIGQFRLIEFGKYSYDGFHAGETLVVSDAATDPRISEDALESYQTVGFLAYIGVPFVQRGRLLGIVAVHQSAPRQWTESERLMVEETAQRAGIAVEQSRAEQALRDSEEQRRVMIELVPALLWSASPDGQEVSLNERWMTYTGQSEAETQGYGWLDALHPDDLPSARAAFEHAFASGEPLERQQRIHKAGDGYRWHLVRHVPVRDAGGTILRWFGAAVEVHELRHLQDRQQILVAELQHRVRNILSVVRSVYSRTVEMGDDIEEIADHFRGRLDSLARTQVVVTQSSSGRADLEDLIRDELLSVGASDGPDLVIEGPAVALSPVAAEVIGLAIHELITNAVKYGALKVDGARIEIRWSVNMDYGDEGWLDLVWSEQGVPAVPLAPARRGFGSELIEEALPYRLGAETSLQFRGGGVCCFISLPLPDKGASTAAASERPGHGETADGKAHPDR